MSNSLRARISKLGYKGLLSEKDVKRIRDALLNEMKYRWHDLRKNPDDLPKEHINYFPIEQSSFSDNVLVMTDKWYRPIVAYINLSIKEWFNPITENTLEAEELGKVIAWREIEKFEVEEE